MNRVLRCALALSATAALIISSSVVPANAQLRPFQPQLQPQPFQPQSLPQSIRPTAPDIPSDQDIANAKQNQAATTAEVTKIESIVSAASANVDASMAATARANDNYSNALVTLQAYQAKSDAAQARATEASKAAEKARTQVGQLAGEIYKNGNISNSLPSLFTGSNSSDAIYQATSLMAIGDSRTKTFENAQSTTATASSLNEAADQSKKAADDAAKTAAEAKATAEAAYNTQNTILAQNQQQRSVLVGQLATLNNTTSELEDQRLAGLEQQQRDAQLAATIAASSNKPAPNRPAPNSPAGNSGGNSAGNGTGTGGSTGSGGSTSAGGSTGGGTTGGTTGGSTGGTGGTSTGGTGGTSTGGTSTGSGSTGGIVQPPPPPPPVVQPPPVIQPPPPPPVIQPPSGVNIAGVVNFMMSKVGGSYVWGGTGPGYDCSGLIWAAFQSVGMNIPRGGSDQFWNAPTRVPISQMKYGDILAFNDNGTGFFSHVGIYIGNGQIVHALNPFQGILVNRLTDLRGLAIYGYAARY